ncbi:hypothetical protein ABFX02_08G059900 [Erythranthe guttata]
MRRLSSFGTTLSSLSLSLSLTHTHTQTHALTHTHTHTHTHANIKYFSLIFFPARVNLDCFSSNT